MAALSPQAILEGRSSNRAPVPLIVGLIVCGLCSLLALAYYLLTGGAIGTAISFFLALPTAVVLIGLILLIDRLEPEPRLNLVVAFAWGAGVAIVGSFIVNTGSQYVLLPFLGENGTNFVGGAVVAPLVEESFKGSFLLLLLFFRRQEIDGPTDGIVYASLAALGFALVENVLYYLNGLKGLAMGDSDSLVVMIVIRGIVAPLGHPLYTSMIGLGVAYAATHRGPGRFFAVVGGWVGAVVLHSLWNSTVSFGLGGMLLSYPILTIVLVVFIVVVVRDRRRIVRLIQTHLPAYGQSGLVQPNDVRMLGTMAGRRQARRWAFSHAGLRGVQAMSDYQLAATELALLHARATNRAIEPASFHTRRDAIVSLMRAARDAFFRRLPQAPPPPWVGKEPSGFVTLPPSETMRLPAFRPGTGVPSPPRGVPGAVPPMSPPGAHPWTPPQGRPHQPAPQERPRQAPAQPGAVPPGPSWPGPRPAAPRPGPPSVRPPQGGPPGFPPRNPGGPGQ
jgi:RsiW-degrading membrane proteinase PrsW (M82 family)